MHRNKLIKILCLEDSTPQKILIKKMISQTKLFEFSLIETSTLKETLIALTDYVFDILLLDLNVSDSSGIETIKSIHNLKPLIPIVVMTVSDEEALILEAGIYGARQYLVKGDFDSNLLCRTILYTLDNFHLISELQKTRYQQEAILSSIPDMAWLKDGNGRFISVNKAFGDACGFKPEELIGMSDLDLWPDRQAEKYRADDKEVMRTGKRQFIRELFTDKSGKTQWVETIKTPIVNESGEVIGTSGIARDITNQKKLENELLQISREWQETFDTINDAISIHDTEFNILRANKTAVAMLKKDGKEVMSSKCFELFHDKKCCIENCPGSITLKTGEASGYECFEPYLNKFLEIKTLPRINENNNTIGFIHVVRDITFRKQAEAAVIESKALIEAVVENVPLMIFLKEATDLRFVLFNRAGEELLGYDRKALLGKNNLDLFPPEQAANFMTKDREVLDSETGILDIQEEPILTAKKGTRLLHTHKVRIKGIDGTTKFLLGISEDITERRKVEKELQNAYNQLKNAQIQLLQSEKMSSIGQLAAGVAHEINNPVGFVMSNISTLREYVGTFKMLISEYSKLFALTSEKKYEEAYTQGLQLDSILKESDIDYILKDVDQLISESLDGTTRIKDIVQSLKSFARIDEAQLKEANINECIETTLKIVWNELKYKCELEKKLSPLPLIQCYPGQLNQVFMNMLMNAAQAIPEKGKITIETKVDNDVILINFTDTGSGISPENISKIFDPFFTTKPVGKGTGLGLAITYGIIEKHNGKIEVQSEIGIGTTFSIRIPFREVKI